MATDVCNVVLLRVSRHQMLLLLNTSCQCVEGAPGGVGFQARRGQIWAAHLHAHLQRDRAQG